MTYSDTTGALACVGTLILGIVVGPAPAIAYAAVMLAAAVWLAGRGPSR